MGTKIPKALLPLGARRLQFNTPIPRPTSLTTPNVTRIQLAVLPQYTFWTDRQTNTWDSLYYIDRE